MADSNTFEIPSTFWDDFLSPSALHDDPIVDSANSTNVTQTNETKRDSKPEALVDPNQTHTASSINAQGNRLDALQADDFPSQLHDDLWNGLAGESSLTEFDKFLQESLNSEPYQSPEFLVSPAMMMPSELPVAPSFEAPWATNWLSQGPAPTAMMYQSPNEWTAPNQAVRQEPKAPVIPTPKSRKRKAVGFDESAGQDMLAVKRQKVQAPRRTILTRKAISNRTANIRTFDASRVYDPLPYRPQNWSIFKYTRYGELEPKTLYTPSQIQYYLYRHHLQTLPDGSKALKKGRLRLWIQRNPADSKKRYPVNLQSNRCRFKDCFATNNVINQGHLRLCFDEFAHLNSESLHTNPFHCAGYVHLNCLERFLDFPQICHDLPVVLDSRDMPLEPEGRNSMSLAPHHLRGGLKGRAMWDVASNFLYECDNEALIGYPKGARPHPGTFVWRLMLAKVGTPSQLGDTSRSRVIIESHISVHLGDLEIEAGGRQITQRREESNLFLGVVSEGVIEDVDEVL
ncbi:MAG: hypothetical protein Q9169_005883 [Polycauliona sp. 2 TL-2023]